MAINILIRFLIDDPLDQLSVIFLKFVDVLGGKPFVLLVEQPCGPCALFHAPVVQFLVLGLVLGVNDDGKLLLVELDVVLLVHHAVSKAVHHRIRILQQVHLHELGHSLGLLLEVVELLG